MFRLKGTVGPPTWGVPCQALEDDADPSDRSDINPLDDRARRTGNVETELNKMLLGKPSNILAQNRRMIAHGWNVGLMAKVMQVSYQHGRLLWLH